MGVMLDTEDTMATPTLTTARGLLMLSPLLMPSLLPMLRPIPGWLMAMAITLIATAMPDTEDTMATLMPTMARGLLMLSPPLMPSRLPMLRLIPGWLMAMAITPIATAMPDTEDTTATPTLTMARGLLMLSPPLMPSPLPMLRPIPGWLMATAITLTAMVMLDTEDTMATPTLTTARGLLMLSPPLMPSLLLMLRPIPGWLMAMAITPIATATPDTEDTTATLMPTMARGLLMLSPPLMLTLRLTPG